MSAPPIKIPGVRFEHLIGKGINYMGAFLISGTETLIIITPILLIILLQLLLCFKSKVLIIKLLPALFFILTTIVFFILMRVSISWDALGYALLFVYSGILLIVDGITWAVWAILKRIINKKQKDIV